MKVWICPGSFDPFTVGHLDIAKRAAKLCDILYIMVMANRGKNQVFSIEERVDMIKTCVSDIENIKVEGYHGLLVDVMREKKASAVVRGLRSESDYRFEAELATANKLLYSDCETILFPCSIELAFTSSSIVKEIGFYGGDISKMLPEQIQEYVSKALHTYYNNKKGAPLE